MRVYPLSFPGISLILSNNHVMGAVGPTLCPNTAPPGTWILNPGTLDIGSDPGPDPQYLVGLLLGYFPIDFTPGASNLVDAALALTVPALAGNDILGIGVPVAGLDVATLGMPLIKSGRTTGVTTGTVTTQLATVNVGYGPPVSNCGTARFEFQFISTDMSDPGDSGSVVLNDNTNVPVGLLFAGNPTSTVMNHIVLVYYLGQVFVDGMSPDAMTIDQLTATFKSNLDPEVIALVPTLESNKERLMALDFVHGVGIGKVGEETGIHIHTDKDLTPAQKATLPGRVNGAPVKVFEGGAFTAY